MGQHVGTNRSSRVDRGGELVYRKLHMIELVGRGSRPAARHHLDLVGPSAQHFPSRAPHLVGPVRQDRLGREAGDFREGPATGAGAVVAMAAGL